MNVFSVVRNIVYIYLLIVNLFLHIIYIIEYIQAIQQGNSEGARIYAQDAIREKNQVSCSVRSRSRNAYLCFFYSI